jgi:hypothetical protein
MVPLAFGMAWITGSERSSSLCRWFRCVRIDTNLSRRALIVTCPLKVSYLNLRWLDLNVGKSGQPHQVMPIHRVAPAAGALAAGGPQTVITPEGKTWLHGWSVCS